MNMKKYCFVLLLAALSTVSLMAQSSNRWKLSLGGAIPVGYFPTMWYDENTLETRCGLFEGGESAYYGGAEFGISLGAEMMHPLNERLDFTISADIHCNGLNGKAKSFTIGVGNYLASSLEQQAIRDGSTSVTSTCSVDANPIYINVPVLAGVSYSFPLSNGMKLFGEAGVGMNFSVITPLKYTARMDYLYRGTNYKLTIEEKSSYSSTFALAFRVGVGFAFTEKLSVSADYYYLGKKDIFATLQAQSTERGAQPNVQEMDLGTVTPMLLTVRLGYTF